jgi:nucleoside-diphosphate-sugar epimerase
MMRIFVAGATGAVGRRLVPQLVAAGHDVVGSYHSSGPDRVQRAGAQAIRMDGLDRESVRAAVLSVRPDVVVHQLSALASMADLKHFDRSFARTNALRTTGTDHLLEASREAGVQRFLAQSYTGWPNPRSGSRVKDESDGLDPNPTAASRETLAGIRYLEQVVTGADGMVGIALRYGTFYGPGTGFSTGGDTVEAVRSRKLPLVGDGTGIWSFVHLDDACAATVQALDHGTAGVYNIVDDEPAPVSEWLPHLALVLGARPPVRVPAWLVRPLVGGHLVSMMTVVRGSSNARARRELGWQLRYPSWREGFRTGLDAA